MSGSSFFALLDDIATVLDDVALMSKVAAKKTAGVLGDDLALNAQQVSGVRADRELPVVWSVAKGSFINKLILVPLALIISALVPQLISPLLIVGGLYLCFEGVEKIWHSLFHSSQKLERQASLHMALANENIDLLEFEKTKIKGAIRTDFVLSAEIIVIALGTVSSEAIGIQTLVVSLIAMMMTIGVYGAVAVIVKLDDMGLHLLEVNPSGYVNRVKNHIGQLILAFCPLLMKSLSIIGTLAMFLVGGGIIVHGVEPLHHYVEIITAAQSYPLILASILNLTIGSISGMALLAALKLSRVIAIKFKK